ncbi:protein kinase [Pseudomonas sp.]|jgi:hypothetical protein|uniref:protein kinase n=1 Tax=Pseudomonas sp. TaxID=306 RepID=UPI0037C50621
MSIERLHHPAVNLLCGQGLDLPHQVARCASLWLPAKEGRPPALLIALLWARECTDLVRDVEVALAGLLADCCSTPAQWTEAQALRQVLAGFNGQLFRQRQKGQPAPQFNAGLLLVQGAEVLFLQAGAIGLVQVSQGEMQQVAGLEGCVLGAQAELALVQHRLSLQPGARLLLAPQPLLAVSDLSALRPASSALNLSVLLAPLLQAPGAAVLLQAGEVDAACASAHAAPWPVVSDAQPGLQVDGWTLVAACPFGPPGRLFSAIDERGREALLWLAEQPAGEAFRQREWALRRSPVAGLAQVMRSLVPRQHAFWLLEPVHAGMRSLSSRIATQGPMSAAQVLAVIEQLITAVRGLQRRGMQGLWLDPRAILLDDAGRVLLLPEHAALLPGVPPQVLPDDALPLAPEVRTAQVIDGRADQFALAAIAYWLCSARWPEVAHADADVHATYRPLAGFGLVLPQGWDGVLARALAPRAAARFEALSEFQQALRQPLQHEPAPSLRARRLRQPWHLAALAVVVVQLAVGLWLSLAG